jgi:hypothetical protein
LQAPLQDVWDSIYNSMEWPQWWKAVKRVEEIQPNDENGINGIRKYSFGRYIPYELNFTMRLIENEPLKRLKGVAYGELEGTGEWFFSENNGIVHVQYNWDIVSNKKWMNTFAFLLSPLFNFFHKLSMQWGGKGLAKKLGTKLIK